MLLDCPVCATSYPVHRADLAGGRLVICPRCDARWRVDADGLRERYGAPGRAASVAPIPRDTLFAALRPALAIAACLAASMLLIGARERVVRMVPRTASLYHAIGLPVNIRGLAFVDIKPERLAEAAQVSITGRIKNVADHREAVPRLAYEVRDATGAPLITWTEQAPAKVVAAGKTLAFASLPHLLPEEARSVFVRFDTDAPVRTRTARGD